MVMLSGVVYCIGGCLFYVTTGTYFLSHQRESPSSDGGHWCGLLLSSDVPSSENLVTKLDGRMFAKQIIANVDLRKLSSLSPSSWWGQWLSLYLAGPARRWLQPLQRGSFPALHYASFSEIFPKTLSHLQKFKQESANVKLSFHKSVWIPWACLFIVLSDKIASALAVFPRSSCALHLCTFVLFSSGLSPICL